MPLFDFSETTGRLRTKSSFWIYWAITVPLTLAVLAIYLIYLVWIRRKDQLEDKAIKRRMDRDAETEAVHFSKMARSRYTSKSSYTK